MKARDRLVLSIIGLAGVMAAVWFLALAPKREEAAKVSGQVAAAEKRRDAANAKASQAELAQASYKHDYATVARLGKATPPQADVPSLVYQLESAARRAKVDFRSVSVEKPPDPASANEPAASTSGITTLPFSFTFEGSFRKLNKLLSSVDRFSSLRGQKIRISGRLLTLDTVSLSAGRSGFPDVKVLITARAYTAPVPDVLSGGSAANPATSKPNHATQVTP